MVAPPGSLFEYGGAHEATYFAVRRIRRHHRCCVFERAQRRDDRSGCRSPDARVMRWLRSIESLLNPATKMPTVTSRLKAKGEVRRQMCAIIKRIAKADRQYFMYYAADGHHYAGSTAKPFPRGCAHRSSRTPETNRRSRRFRSTRSGCCSIFAVDACGASSHANADGSIRSGQPRRAASRC